MTRIRTHNNRAKRVSYAKFASRRRRYEKIARHAAMYGMGPHRLREAFQLNEQDYINRFFLDYPTIGKWEEFANGGTVTGRMVRHQPEMQGLYQRSRRELVIPATDYAEQEMRALAMHRESLDRLRAEGHTVIEHTSADATVVMKGTTND